MDTLHAVTSLVNKTIDNYSNAPYWVAHDCMDIMFYYVF